MKRLCLTTLLLLAASCNFDAEMAEYCDETRSCAANATGGGFCVVQDVRCEEGQCCAGLTCGAGGTCVPASQLSASPAAVDFGRFPDASSAVPVLRTVTLRNTGAVATGGVRVALPATVPTAFQVDAAGCEGRVLAPGDECTLQLFFTPSRLGKQQLTLTLTHTGPFVPVELPATGTVGVALSVDPTNLLQGSPYAIKARLQSEPAGIDCMRDGDWQPIGECVAYYRQGTEVTLRSANGAGVGVDTWTGPCTQGEPTCTVRLDVDTHVGARFSPWLQVAVENLEGMGGVVEVGTGYNARECLSQCNHPLVGEVQLTARAPQGQFMGWGGDCAAAGSAPTCTLDVQGVRRAVARFAPLNRIFKTSLQMSALGPDLAGADAYCQSLGRSYDNIDRQYRAWLSTPTASAASRMGTARGWMTPAGRPFADTLEDLLAGRIFHPLATLGHDPMATGTPAAGSTTASTCDGWTGSGGGYTAGAETATTGSWTEDLLAEPQVCASYQFIRFYCFGTRFQTPIQLAPTPNAGLAFLSTPWTPAGGVAGADAHCQQDAKAAGLGTGFRAMVASAGQTVSNRLFPRFDACKRVDGVSLGSCRNLMGGLADTPLNVTAAGEYVGSSGDPASARFVWTGGTYSRYSGGANTQADTCNDWTGGVDATGTVGRPEFIGPPSFQASTGPVSIVACSSAQRLYCIQAI